jgi:hypothetical protein
MIERFNPSARGAIALALLVFLPTFIRAQFLPSTPREVIKVGDPSVDGSFLRPYKNASKVVYAFPGKEPFLVGSWTDELSAVDINGRHLLNRSQLDDYAKYNIVATYVNVFDSKTMSPIFMTLNAVTPENGHTVISRWRG